MAWFSIDDAPLFFLAVKGAAPAMVAKIYIPVLFKLVLFLNYVLCSETIKNLDNTSLVFLGL